MNSEVCLITGVGPGTGSALVKVFVEAGYRVAMLARDGDRLSKLEQELDGAHGYVCDVADEQQVAKTVEAVTQDLGAPDVFIHNAVGGGFGDFLSIDPADLEKNFQVNTMALLHFGRLLAPKMIERGKGTILCTGNTSAYRGKASFASFAPSKAAQRILAESMARYLGPKGIHVAYIAIDAVIDVPWTREMMPEKHDDFFCRPVDIASQCLSVAQQPKSAWSFNVEVRPYGESW
jgi:NAD(P)-dependent dehydrogenase (short-subunit alcohol dehydrogenase family)